MNTISIFINWLIKPIIGASALPINSVDIASMIDSVKDLVLVKWASIFIKVKVEAQ